MTTLPAADAPVTPDTQAPLGTDTAANTQQSPQPIDWQARYRALQAEFTAKAQAVASRDAELEKLRAQADAGDDETDEDAPAQRRKASRASEREAALAAALEEAEWTIARSIYPDEVIDAYASAAGLLERAQTAADYVGAFEAYHQARNRGATPQQAAEAAPTPAVPPIADSNRSDAPVLPEIENQLREAAQKRDLTSWVGAKLKQLG